MDKINKIAIFSTILGLTFFAVVIFTNSSYPNMLFRVFMPLGLLCIAIGFILNIFLGIKYIKNEIKQRNYFFAIIMSIAGIYYFIKFIK